MGRTRTGTRRTRCKLRRRDAGRLVIHTDVGRLAVAYLCVVLTQIGAVLGFASVVAASSYLIPGWLGMIGMFSGFGLWICAVRLDEAYPSLWKRRKSWK